MWWKDWSYIKRGVIIGLIIGVILIIINTLLVGLLGLWTISFLIDPLLNLTDCAGEDCWFWWVIFGDIIFLIIFVLIGFIYGKFKNRNQGEKK